MIKTDAKEWAGFAAHMLPPPPNASPEQLQARNEQMLMRALHMGTTVAVVGSGCSVPLDYPNWQGFARQVVRWTKEALIKEALIRPALPPDKLTRVLGFEKHLGTGAPAKPAKAAKTPQQQKVEGSSDLMMYYIGACQEILEQEGRIDRYHDQIKKCFKPRAARVYKRKINPYRALVQLPISRFVTTNFDCEIERTLEEAELVRRGTFFDAKGRIKAEPGASFHQLSDHFDAFARFALGNVTENRYNVFHCHGRYDDPRSVVASERQYQDIYLADNERTSVAFRQTFELLLGSNPLLFVGYSLRDDDLLRPLRLLGAVDPQRKHARPIFALLPEYDDRDRDRHAMLFERYGLKVLPFKVTNEKLEVDLCAMLEGLRTKLDAAWQEWLKKPRLREPHSAKIKPDPFLEVVPTQVPVGNLAGFRDAALAPGVVCVEGPSGSGKSLHCLNLMVSLRAKKNRGLFKGSFYWNLHYGNDLLTGIDTMLRYFDIKGGSRVDRFRRCLDERNLVILDGCERLMRKSQGRPRSMAYSTLFNELLRAMLEKDIHGTVVLAGRVLPKQIDGKRAGANVARTFRASPLRSGDLVSAKRFAMFKDKPGRDLLAALCEVLQGHNYGLLMSGHYLDLAQAAGKDRQQALARLILDLAQRPADQRLHAMVVRLLQELDARTSNLATLFLQRLALFLSPASDDTLEICYQQVLAARGLGSGRTAATSLRDLRDVLEKQDFLFKVARRDGRAAYCVHATARSQLFRTLHGQDSDALPDFGLSGPLSGRVGTDPGRDEDPDIRSLFADMLELGESAADRAAGIRPDRRWGTAESAWSTARHVCRDAFGLIRGRMEANTASRWCSDFEEYSRFAIRTAVLAKRVAPGPAWTYGEPSRLAEIAEATESPLHLGELAWLYNDAAMSLYYLGHVRDAYSVWEQTWEIGKLAGAPGDAASLQIEVRLSLISCFLEMGRLPAARRIIEEFRSAELALCDGEVSARVQGLQAMIYHLQGNLPQADRHYRQCLERLRGKNLRAESYFQKQRADLKINMNDPAAAERLIRASRAHAEAGVFPDLVLFARVTEAHLKVRAGAIGEALVEYRTLLRDAQRLRLRRQEAEIEFSMARCALVQGDAEGARQMAITSLRIANEHGLGLRMTHSLAVLGMAMLATGGPGHRRLGIAYLRQAHQLALAQEYWHRGREVEQKLQELGEDLSYPVAPRR